MPRLSAPESVATQDIQLIPVAAPKPPDPIQDQDAAAQLEEAKRQERQLLQSLGIELAPEHAGERKYPWLIDILLYPASSTGLTILALLIGIPLLLKLLERLAPLHLPGLLGLPFLVIGFMAGLYIGWYMAECVYDSAKGGTRAPASFPLGLGTGELWSRVSYLLAVYIIYLFPAVFYRMFFGTLDVIFWALTAWAILFFPMGLLAMVMHDSVSALNPLLLLGSIFRTFSQYVGLIILFLPFAGIFWLSGRTLEDAEPSILLDAVGLVVTSYVPFILAHLLGRFYWRNGERLDWGT